MYRWSAATARMLRVSRSAAPAQCFRIPVTGIVDRDAEKCVGCWMCAMICPYGVIGRQLEVRVAVKCDRCKDLDTPACVRACPAGTLVFATQSEFMEVMRKAAAARIAQTTSRRKARKSGKRNR